MEASIAFVGHQLQNMVAVLFALDRLFERGDVGMGNHSTVTHVLSEWHHGHGKPALLLW